MTPIEKDKIVALCEKWGLKELNFTNGLYLAENGTGITVNLRGDVPLVGVTIAGQLHLEGHGNLKVEDYQREIEAIMKSSSKKSQSSNNDKKQEVKDDSHKITQRKSDKNIITARPREDQKTEVKGGQESPPFMSSSTEQMEASVVQSGQRAEILEIPGFNSPAAPNQIHKLQKAKCKECNTEFELTLDAAQKIFEEYEGIYCMKCRAKEAKHEKKEAKNEKKEGSDKVMETKINSCIVCGVELSGARALECFKKDLQKPVMICEDCEEVKPEVITKEPKQKSPSDARIPVLTHTTQGSIIKGFQPSLKEIGKIKIGGKGEERQKTGGGTFRIPVKYDHFEIKSLVRDVNGDFMQDQVMDILGESPKELDVMLLFNDPTLNFITRYNQYQGGKCLCQGDGEMARQLDGTKIECNPETCSRFAKKLCKPNGILSVILIKSPRLGGVYKFRTTSFNSIRSILSSMFFLSSITGGVLAMIPLRLTVSPMQVQPKDSAKPQTIYVVNIEFSGTAPELLQKTFEVQKYQSAMREDIMKLENKARAVLTAPETMEEIKEIEAEYYPEQQKEAK